MEDAEQMYICVYHFSLPKRALFPPDSRPGEAAATRFFVDDTAGILTRAEAWSVLRRVLTPLLLSC